MSRAAPGSELKKVKTLGLARNQPWQSYRWSIIATVSDVQRLRMSKAHWAWGVSWAIQARRRRGTAR
jgi:hypothetical protein